MHLPRLIAVLALIATPALATSVAALTITPGSAWPGPEISVCWEDTSQKRRQERDLIRKAVRWTWERESAVRFTGWRACRPGSGGVRIGFEAAYPQTKGRGAALDGVPDGVQLPTLWSLAALSVNIKAPVHEFGHVLGFGHEYARRDVADPDRCGAKLNGARYIEDDVALTPYDEHSVMVGCRPGATRQFSSGVPSLSAGDIFGLVGTYGSHPDNVLDPDEDGDLFGQAVLAADLDGDGVSDLAIGAPGEDRGQGAVYLYRGDEVKGLRPWRKIAAPAGSQAFGQALTDVRADNAEDGGAVIVLTVGDAGGADRPHRVVVSALDGSTGRGYTAAIDGKGDDGAIGRPAALDRFADDLRTGPSAEWQIVLSDLDGDGVSDAIAGAPMASVDGHQSGAVIVFRGLPTGGFAEWYWFGQRY